MLEEEAIYILQNRQMLLQTIRTKREMICSECCSVDDQIQELVLQGKKLREDMISPTNDNKDKMLNVLERQQKRFRQEAMALEEELNCLADQERKINRVWTCFRCLPPEDFALLKELYVENNKWDTVAGRQGVSKSTITKSRKLAVQKLVILVNSEYEEIKKLRELSGKFTSEKSGLSDQPDSKRSPSGQISLSDYFL